MSKSRILIFVMLLFIFFAGVFPFLNAVGCNAVFDVKDSHLSVSGRCEAGEVEATFVNSDTRDIYTITGRMAMVSSQFFIFVDDVVFLEQSNVREHELKRYKYHRDVISGRLIDDKYILMYTPYANVAEVNIIGRMSFW